MDDKEKIEKLDTDSWDDFSGDYLKTDLIKKWPLVLVPVDMEGFSKDGEVRLVMHTEYNDRKKKLNINKTNQAFIRSKKIGSPKELIGKKVTFEKIKVRNPSTNQQVDSFSITNIE